MQLFEVEAVLLAIKLLLILWLNRCNISIKKKRKKSELYKNLIWLEAASWLLTKHVENAFGTTEDKSRKAVAKAGFESTRI